MKKYKDYMDRISFGEEAHHKLMEALAAEEKRLAEGNAAESEPESLPFSSRAYPWYKRRGAMKWGPYAAALLVVLLLSAAILYRNVIKTPASNGNQIDSAWDDAQSQAPNEPVFVTAAPPFTRAVEEHSQGTQSATLAESTTALTPTYAPTTALTPTYAPTTTVNVTDAQGRVLPAVNLCYYYMDEMATLILEAEDALTVENFLFAGTKTSHPVETEEEKPAPCFERTNPDEAGHREGIFLQYGNAYYRFLPEKADQETMAIYEKLLEKYGLKE